MATVKNSSAANVFNSMWNIIAASALLDIKKRFDNIRNTSKYELSFYKGFQVIAKVC